MPNYRVTKEIQFCYGHRLMDYQGKCQHPHGHNARVEVELIADILDKKGMVMDFSEIKAHLKNWIDGELDHRMILRRDDPLGEWLKSNKEPVYLLDENPTAESLAKLIYSYMKKSGYLVSCVRFWETPTSFATYSE